MEKGRIPLLHGRFHDLLKSAIFCKWIQVSRNAGGTDKARRAQTCILVMPIARRWSTIACNGQEGEPTGGLYPTFRRRLIPPYRASHSTKCQEPGILIAMVL